MKFELAWTHISREFMPPTSYELKRFSLAITILLASESTT